MSVLQDYLHGMSRVHSTGEAVEETSYYGQVERLLNEVGARLSPNIMCVLTSRNRGVGVPDGGLFVVSQAVERAGRRAMVAHAPERGVLEVKGPGKDVRRVARTQQVRRYLMRYGKVLVTTYRQFLIVSLGQNGQPVEGELFTLASDEESFWALTSKAKQVESELETQFVEYLKRVLLGDAPLSQPADLASFLAAYAREGRRRLDLADSRHRAALGTLRSALEDGLGLRFSGPEGESAYSRLVIGWSIAEHMRTELVTDALGMAILRRQPNSESTILHSDHGAQYTSFAFGQRLRKAGLLGPMGSIGDCFDNAMMESFWGTMQLELLDSQ